MNSGNIKRLEHIKRWRFETILFGILSLIPLVGCFNTTRLYFTDLSFRSNNYINGIVILYIVELIFLSLFIIFLVGLKRLYKHPELIGLNQDGETFAKAGVNISSIPNYIKNSYISMLLSSVISGVSLVILILIVPSLLSSGLKVLLASLFQKKNVLPWIFILSAPGLISGAIISFKYKIYGGLQNFVFVNKNPVPIFNYNIFNPFQTKSYGLNPPFWIGKDAKIRSILQIFITVILLFFSVFYMII